VGHNTIEAATNPLPVSLETKLTKNNLTKAKRD